MCYNPEISFTFFGLGIISTLYIVFFNKKLLNEHFPLLILFYSGMELLQGMQYHYVNNCSHFMNKLLTEIAYVYVIVQPLLWNFFFYINSDSCDKRIFVTGMVLATIWLIANLTSRLIYKPSNSLTPADSAFANNTVCTKRKTAHLYWKWTIGNMGEFRATFLTYLLIWFVPALVSSKFRTVSIILMASAILGAFMSYSAGDIETFTATWCYISVPMVLAVILFKDIY